MINNREEEAKYLSDFNYIIDKLNIYYEKRQGFSLKDLLSDKGTSVIWLRDTRGYLQTLINFEYIEIFTKVGNGSYIYIVKKQIPKKYN